MSSAQNLLADIQRRVDHAEAVVFLRETLASSTPITPAQRALVETQLNMLGYSINSGSALLPVLEDLTAKDDLILLGLDDLLRKILVAVYEGLIKLIRWATIWVTKLFSRARGLLMEVRAVRGQMADLRGLTATRSSFSVSGELAKNLHYGGRFALNYPTLSEAFTQSRQFADILLAGSYPSALEDLGKRLAGALSALRTDDPRRLLSATNASMEQSISNFGISDVRPGRHRTVLLGNYTIEVTIPNVHAVDPVMRSRQIQDFNIEYLESSDAPRKLAIETLNADELNQLLGHVENGLLLILDYDKKQVAVNLLKSAGGLQTQLNKVLRELDHLRDTPDVNDCMIALARYMTAYAAWVQDPIEHYARYFLNLNASLLQACRLSMRQYS